MNQKFFHRDCPHFRSDRPCVEHKRTGQQCEGCGCYVPQSVNLLILKFDAIGDVLRSTSILHGIKRQYPGSHVVWYTRRNCKDLFLHNPCVNEVLYLEDPSSVWKLMSQRFDVVYSLDPSSQSACITKSLNASTTRGFSVDDLGRTVPIGPDAGRWYAMGLDDGLKRANRETFFDHLFRMAGIQPSVGDVPLLVLSDEEIREAELWKRELGLCSPRQVIGINPGAGFRWRNKRWNEAYYVELIDRLLGDDRFHLVMLGGEEDESLISSILARVRNPGRIVYTGSHPLRRFIMHVWQTDLVVCGDTLALHIATAFQKKVIALFGPTSSAEIDLFGRGEKVVSDLPCACCYLPDCDIRPSCMDSIDPMRVLMALLRLAEERPSDARAGCDGRAADD